MKRAAWRSRAAVGPGSFPNDVPAEDVDSPARMEPVQRSPSRAPSRQAAAFVEPAAPWAEARRKGHRPAPLALRLLVVLFALVAAASLATLVALRGRPSWFVGLRDIASPTLPPTASRPIASRHVAGPSTTPPTSTAASLSISALVPSSGVSGEHVTILGSDLVGPGGYLVATFNGSPVPTSCPSEQQCDAVVPPRPHRAGEVVVRLRSEIGFSNALSFRYS